ncbi:MAG: NAD(P)/FAD-dependent oxidoreductase, partial [Propionibacteriaceae bacterium]
LGRRGAVVDAAQVTLVVRGDSLTKSMSSYLIEQVEARDNIDVRTCTQVEKVEGEEHLSAVTLFDKTTGQHDVIDAEHLFVFIGAAPLTDWLDGEVVRDPRGFVVTGPELLVEGRRPDGWDLQRDPYLLESSLPGVFVAGDARADSVKRVASAVGEGALAVTLVHRYLAEQ